MTASTEVRSPHDPAQFSLSTPIMHEMLKVVQGLCIDYLEVYDAVLRPLVEARIRVAWLTGELV